jgi:hypothetical protein
VAIHKRAHQKSSSKRRWPIIHRYRHLETQWDQAQWWINVLDSHKSTQLATLPCQFILDSTTHHCCQSPFQLQIFYSKRLVIHHLHRCARLVFSIFVMKFEIDGSFIMPSSPLVETKHHTVFTTTFLRMTNLAVRFLFTGTNI